MSLEQLRQDFKLVAAAIPSSPEALGRFMADNLIPWLDGLLTEIGEQDEAIEDLVNHSADVLHEESAEVFAGIIAGGRAIAAELKTRAPTDRRILKLCSEYLELCTEGQALLEDITYIDPDPDADSDAEDPATPTAEAASTEMPSGAATDEGKQ